MPSRSDAMLLPAVLLACVGFGPCVKPAEKSNVPAARASQTFTRSMRPSMPSFSVCRDVVLVSPSSTG